MDKAPLQIWAPVIDISPYDKKSIAAMEMAQQTWSGELRMWLSPEVDRKISWEEEPGSFESLIPAYEANVIDIYHLDSRRRIFPRLSPGDKWFKKGVPSDLYLRWLQAPVELIEKPDTVVFDFPTFEHGRIVKKPRGFRTAPGTIVSGLYVDAAHGEATILGPLRPKERLPVSLMVESEHLFGNAKWELDDNGQTTGFVLSDKLGRFKAQPFRCQWREPFNYMYEGETSLDTLFVRSRIAGLIGKFNEANYSDTVKELESIRDRYVRISQAPISHVDFLPLTNTILNAEHRKCFLMNLEEDHGISFGAFENLKSSSEFIQYLQTPVKIKRINTWTGFFIDQLVEDVLKLEPIRFCAHCGKLFRGGHRDRRFCTKEENGECFRERNTRTQRTRRGVSKQTSSGDDKT